MIGGRECECELCGGSPDYAIYIEAWRGPQEGLPDMVVSCEKCLFKHLSFLNEVPGEIRDQKQRPAKDSVIV